MQSIALPFRHHMNPFLSRMEQRTQRFSTHPYNDPLDKKLRISQLFLLFLMWSVLYGARPGRHNFLICQVNGLSDISLIFFLDFPINPLFFNESLHL